MKKKYVIEAKDPQSGKLYYSEVETKGDIIRAIFIATFNMERDIAIENGYEGELAIEITHAAIIN